jgi:hypothetical protein
VLSLARPMLIRTISIMVTISLNPFVLKRILLVLLILIGLSCASSQAASIFVPVSSTPYDHQMSRIEPILASTGNGGGAELSVRLVNRWIGDLRSIPYGFTKIWKTPDEAQSGEPADCKAKAVALYERMKKYGARNLRLVIGKRSTSSRSSHTWLEWETTGSTYILDPTINWMAYRSSDLDPHAYLPYYAFAGTKKFRASESTLVAQN